MVISAASITARDNSNAHITLSNAGCVISTSAPLNILHAGRTIEVNNITFTFPSIGGELVTSDNLPGVRTLSTTVTQTNTFSVYRSGGRLTWSLDSSKLSNSRPWGSNIHASNENFIGTKPIPLEAQNCYFSPNTNTGTDVDWNYFSINVLSAPVVLPDSDPQDLADQTTTRQQIQVYAKFILI